MADESKKIEELLFGQTASEFDKTRPLIDDDDIPTGIADLGEPSSGKPYYVDEQIGTLAMQYLLKPDIPEKYYPELSKFILAVDKLSALGNIRREDILRFKILFRMVIRWYKLGLPEIARQHLVEFLFEMQLSRSVEGFFTVWRSTQRSIQEEWAKSTGYGSGRKSGFWSRLFGGG